MILNMKVMGSSSEDEKYLIKPRKKYARQVCLLNGKAIIVDPIEFKDTERENGRCMVKHPAKLKCKGQA